MFGGKDLRVFAGLPLPDNIKKDIGTRIGNIKNKFKGLKFVNPDLLHITLYFFGEVKKNEAEQLKKIVKSIKCGPAKTSLGETGCFPSFKNPNVFYISLGQGSRKLNFIYKIFADAVNQLGYKSLKNDFVPHITFARRKKNRIKEDWSVLKRVNFNIDNIIFNNLVLYQSVLKPDGPVYIPLSEVTLC